MLMISAPRNVTRDAPVKFIARYSFLRFIKGGTETPGPCDCFYFWQNFLLPVPGGINVYLDPRSVNNNSVTL